MTRIILGALSACALGAAMAWSAAAMRIDDIRSAHAAEIASLRAAETDRLLRQADAWRSEVERRAALADDIDRQRAAEIDRQARQLQETHNALKTATTGRPCLGGAALRVLDHAAGLRPPAVPAGALQAAAAGPAADPPDGDAYASDADVAGWIATAADLYEQCRGRVDDIRHYDDGGGE